MTKKQCIFCTINGKGVANFNYFIFYLHEVKIFLQSHNTLLIYKNDFDAIRDLQTIQNLGHDYTRMTDLPLLLHSMINTTYNLTTIKDNRPIIILGERDQTRKKTG